MYATIDHMITDYWKSQKIIPASKPGEVQSTVKMYKTLNQVHTPTLQPTHWACINSAIAIVVLIDLCML